MAVDEKTPLRQAHEAILREDPSGQASVLLAELMDQNARHLSATFESLYEGEVAAHARTQARLDEALDQLETIRHRHAWLAGLTDDLVPREWA